MLAIIAVISDIPLYFAEIFSKITGVDTSAAINIFSKGFAGFIEIIEKLLGA